MSFHFSQTAAVIRGQARITQLYVFPAREPGRSYDARCNPDLEARTTKSQSYSSQLWKRLRND
jgi:hypothetical protein